MNVFDLMKLDAQNCHEDGILYVKNHKQMFETNHHSITLISYDTCIQTLLKQIDGCIIAGECFSFSYTDVDIFIYKDHQQTLDKIKNYFGDKNFPFFCSENMIRFYRCFGDKNPDIRVFLYEYKSIADILYKIDLGPNQIGYDGANFYLTIMGKHSFDTGTLIIDHSKIGKTYCEEVMKYSDIKGFNILMPFYNYQYTDIYRKNDDINPYFWVSHGEVIHFWDIDSICSMSSNPILYKLSNLCVLGFESRKRFLTFDDLLSGHGSFLMGLDYTIKEFFVVPYYDNPWFTIMIQKIISGLGLANNIIKWEKAFDGILINDPEDLYSSYFCPLYHPKYWTKENCPQLVKQVRKVLYSYLPSCLVNYIFTLVDQGHACLNSIN